MKNLLIALLCTPFAILSQNIVFNEVNSDNPGGPDNSEFIELHGAPGYSLDGLVVVFFDGNSGTSYSSYDLDGYFLDESGFFVLGNANAVNVDLVIPNAALQNGQDGIALYLADATDFGNGSTPTTTDLLDAVVYGTGDAAATNLISGLGLEVSVPGYVQLDETVQQTGTDLSLSRVPDGGDPFIESTFVLQEITPGTWNTAQCNAGAIFFPNSSTSVTICEDEENAIVHYSTNGTSTGDSLFFVFTSNGLINLIVTADSLDVTELSIGEYEIYAASFNGDIDNATLAEGLPIEQINATSCVSISEIPVTLHIVQCGGCIGGEISSLPLIVCNGENTVFEFTNTSSSEQDSYFYVITDATNHIVDIFNSSYTPGALDAGTYSVHGISFMGEIENELLSPGSDFSLLTASTCMTISSNSLPIDVYECNEIQPCSVILISEYLEGNNGTKAIELFNPSITEMNMLGYSLHTYNNGATTPTYSLMLEGVIPPLGTFVIANPGTALGNGQADPDLLALADITDIVANFSGNDAVELRLNGEVIDAIGIVGNDPGNMEGWPAGNGSTRNNDLVRKMDVRSPMIVWQVNASQWDVFDLADYSHIGNHSFQPCGDEVLAGISSSTMYVEENAGTISIDIQALNVDDPITLVASVIGGTAEVADYSATFPVNMIFDGTTTVIPLAIDIIDDMETEPSETIVIALSSPDDVTWLTQEITITILQSDPNCDGGSISTMSGTEPIDQCADEDNDPIALSYSSTMNASYVFVVTNENDSIVSIIDESDIDMDVFTEGVFRIYGLSFTGQLNQTSIQSNLLATDIEADSCASLSSNFITIIRSACIVTGCVQSTVGLDHNITYASICRDTQQDLMAPQSAQNSTDDFFIYVITDVDHHIVDSFPVFYDANQLDEGTFLIYGLSFTDELSNFSVGQPLDEIVASDCLSLSENFIELYVADCGNTTTCSFLMFSEYIEDIQSNKAFEIYNPTDVPINLSGYSVNMYSNGALIPTNTLLLEGTIAPHDVFVVVNPGNGQNPIDPAMLAASDTLHSTASITGNDALELLFNEILLDVIGVVGTDPGQGGWIFGNSSTSNHVLVRRSDITTPNPDWAIVSGQWISYPQTDFSFLGWHDAQPCSSLPIPEIGFTLTSQEVPENTGNVQVTINAVNIPSPMSVAITVSGTATEISDYAAFPLTIDFPTGSSQQSFSIEVTSDVIPEGDETIILTLSAQVTVNWLNPQTIITIQEETGLAEIEDQHLVVFPNPASDVINLVSSSPVIQTKLVDSMGRIIYTRNANGQKKLALDLSDFSAGNYLLEVTSEQDTRHIPITIFK